MGQTQSYTKESSQEISEIGLSLQRLCTRTHLLPQATYAFIGCPCRKTVGESSSGALNGTPYKEQWRRVGEQEAKWLSEWKQSRPRSFRASVSARGCVVLAPAPLSVSLTSQESWAVSAASTGVAGSSNTFPQVSAAGARDKLKDMRSRNPRVQLKVQSIPATVKMKDVAAHRSVLSHSQVIGGACAVFQEAVLGAELTLEFPGCRWGPEGGRSTLHDVIVRQQGGPAFKLPLSTGTVDEDAIQQAMIAWSSQVEVQPSTWVALQVDVAETVGEKPCEIPRVPQFTSPTDDVTVAEAFLLNLKDPLQLKKETDGALLSCSEKELGAAASAVCSAGSGAIAGQVIVRGLTEEGQLDFAVCHGLLAEMVMIQENLSVHQQVEEQLAQEPQTEPEPLHQSEIESSKPELHDWIPTGDVAMPPQDWIQRVDTEILHGGLDEDEAAVKLQKTIRGKRSRAEVQKLLESRGSETCKKSNRPPPALGVFQPEGSSIGLVLDGQSHPLNNTSSANIAELSFGRSARIRYLVSPESCDAIQYSFSCSTPLGPSALVALVPARSTIENIDELKRKALVWRRVDHTRAEGEAVLPLTDVELFHPLRSEERWELRLFSAEANLGMPGIRCAQIGGGLRCKLDEVPTPETLHSVLDSALRNGSQRVLRRVTDKRMEAEEALVVCQGDFPWLMQALAVKPGMELGDLPPRAPAPLELIGISPGPTGGASRLKMRLAQLQAYTVRVQVQSVQISDSDNSIQESTHADFQAKIPFVCAVDLPSTSNSIFRCREVGPGGAGAWGEWTAPVR